MNKTNNQTSVQEAVDQAHQNYLFCYVKKNENALSIDLKQFYQINIFF